MNQRDLYDLRRIFKEVAESIAERFRDNEKEIQELRAELQQIKSQLNPRLSLNQQLKLRGVK